jgi:hypothetical protein
MLFIDQYVKKQSAHGTCIFSGSNVIHLLP